MYDLCWVQVQQQHSSEIKELERRLTEAKVAASTAEEGAKRAEDELSALRQAHVCSLHAVERTVGQALADAVATARQRSDVQG